MRSDLRRAVALVRAGKTYSEAAADLGLTRNQVGGACKRAGFKVSDTVATSRRARIAKAKAELMRAMRNDVVFNNKRLEALRRSRIQRAL
jgi:predicted transcriptional regulator